MEKKRSVGVLVSGIFFIGIILIGLYYIRGSRVYAESETQLEPIEEFARLFYIKSVTVYKDHIIVQRDKDWAESEAEIPILYLNTHLIQNGPSYTEIYRTRNDEFEQTGRAELQIGEGFVMSEHHFGYSALLKAIRGEIAYIEVQINTGFGYPDPGPPTERKFVIEINRIYERPKKQ